MLVGNGVRTGGNPARYRGGVAAMSINRPGFSLTGSMSNFIAGEAAVFAEADRNGYPSGVSHPTAWVLPRKAGALTSRFNVVGGGGLTGGNLAGGVYGDSTLTGGGDINEAGLTALGGILSALSGAGAVSAAEIVGNIEAAATLLGAGDTTGALISLLNGSAILVGAGSVTGDANGGLEAQASLTGVGSLAGGVSGVVEAMATVLGSGAVLPVDIVGIMDAVATLVGMGDIDGAIIALGHAESLLQGAGEVSNALPYANGGMSALISASGEVLTAQSVAQAVMAYTIESGYSFEKVTRLVAAILAGKTDIVDNGNGTATVTFRNLNDLQDAAVFSVVGSERAGRVD